MKVLVTGGAGYIGTRLIKKLSANKKIDKIIVYDNLMRGNYNLFLGDKFINGDSIEFVKGDLLDSRSLKNALKGVDVVFHLAAKATSPFANVNLHFYEQINNWGTAELTYAVEESDVKKFVYLSSMGVYGFSDDPITEDHPVNPSSFYAISKQRGEEHVKRLNKSHNPIILRCGNVYGYSRSMRFDAVINRFVFEANFDGRLSIHGSGNQQRAFIHISSIADILEQIAVTDIPADTYNVSERNMSVLDIVDVLKELKPELEFLFINQQNNYNQQLVSAEQKLKQYIPYDDQDSFKDQMIEFLNSFSY
ncbi:NAD-dependent epimerase/dehydratase family protein [Reichenbachiella agarivorans]|uniref:NAD-dependent epimerase/dehydratase family protein n=1 Tax=Reichenbachiella agarivorans TaxID=2979464 RepID=A0ABY6CRY2_9BACT|nr:NAD-dependent epimerase/dehydratase family protein [Reichenbachiella agarivorans]UXP33275.1 NAD-dependent epimerase/dehydratase family protein [Reichenbachiella agarivorans]